MLLVVKKEKDILGDALLSSPILHKVPSSTSIILRHRLPTLSMAGRQIYQIRYKTVSENHFWAFDRAVHSLVDNDKSLDLTRLVGAGNAVVSDSD